jgi:hypothetical protein
MGLRPALRLRSAGGCSGSCAFRFEAALHRASVAFEFERECAGVRLAAGEGWPCGGEENCWKGIRGFRGLAAGTDAAGYFAEEAIFRFMVLAASGGDWQGTSQSSYAQGDHSFREGRGSQGELTPPPAPHF